MFFGQHIFYCFKHCLKHFFIVLNDVSILLLPTLFHTQQPDGQVAYWVVEVLQSKLLGLDLPATYA